ncbi:hypothetical protein SEUBUCD646_0M00200 [Saccharomyces eubayanus]|uniref:MSC1-like protein n=1 Tax=Saccharomyces eubayanus TaxID=1080349 RepID=A0ABN8VKG2_SACEU|nr:hypothetical protein SEUBUCD650_0M00190 [Saccharomyces eubayanus]CAI1639330.1 hypothetical protein SEUBUCD646_0M00200 [Saccharomyces eubayanus]
MKQFRLVNAVSASCMIIGLVMANSDSMFSKWTQDDLVDYLHDNKKSLEKYATESIEDLKKEASQVWDKHAQPKPWWQVWSSDSSVGSNSNSGWFGNSGSSVSDWIFDTWSTDSLRNFLKKNGVDVDDAKASKDSLVKTAKENFAKISKSLKSSGYYPSSSYFDSWSTEDLQSWLSDNGIDYDKAVQNKNELVQKVKENIYKTSEKAEQQRLGVLESLDLAHQQILDTTGQIKDTVFDKWSSDQLYNWLENHKVKLDKNMSKKHDYLVRMAKENTDNLKDDIYWYLDYMKRESSPFLAKTPEYVGSVWDSSKNYLSNLYSKFRGKTDNLVNDTFLVDIDSWSKDKLKMFLDARGIKHSMLSTENQLREQVKQSRNEKLKIIPTDYQKYFDNSNWSLNDIKSWFADKKDDFQDSQAYSTIMQDFDKVSKNTNDAKDQISQTWSNTFQSWSQEDLLQYLKSFGVPVKQTSTKDDLINLAKQNTQWLFGTVQEPVYKRYFHNVKNWSKSLLRIN